MRDLEQMKRMLSSVFEQHEVVLAYLFGSVSRDNAGTTSDVDVAVLFREEETSIEKKIKRQTALAGDIEDLLRREVDLVDLEEATSPLLKHRIVRRGELLYCCDHKIRQDLELKALHEFEDTRHLRAIQKQAMEKRIKEGVFGKPL